MTPAEHIAFTRRLGPLHVMKRTYEATLPEYPEVFVVSNAIRDGKPIGLKRADEGFHTDGEDKPIPNAEAHMSINISSNFDCGNIEVIDVKNPQAIRLNIRKEQAGELQDYIWFYFALTGAKGQRCTFIIENASGNRWAPEAWKDYRIVASYDRTEWFRIPIEYDGTSVSWCHAVEHDRVYYAYHAPYHAYEHGALLERCAASPRARVEVLGETNDGRDVDLVTVGEPGTGKRVCWIIARQHCGETQAEAAAEALLDRLIDESDPVSRALLQQAVCYVVPNMNPDGSARGNHRTNALQIDLNRAWTNTTRDKSPEVWLVREHMLQTGVDFLLDLHADENRPFVYPVHTPGIPSLSQRQVRLREAFDAALVRASPDYSPDEPKGRVEPARGSDPLAMAISWAAEKFGCLALIIEFPFLDNSYAPDERCGWSHPRSRRFGAACLNALLEVARDLRS
jgi:murein tripeptide amidase MpaA